MHIVFVWDYFSTVLKYHFNYLADELTALGHEVTVLASDKGTRLWRGDLKELHPPAGEYTCNDVKLIRFKSWSPLDRMVPKNWFHLRRVLRELSPDVLHLYGVARPMSVLATFFAMRLKHPPVLFANDHSLPRGNVTRSATRGLTNLSYHLFFAKDLRKLITPTTATMLFLKERYNVPDDRIRVIPLGFDAQTFFFDPNKKNQTPKLVVGFAGRLERRKRIELLFEAIAKSEYRDQIECHIAGDRNDEYSQELKELSKQLALDVTYRPLLNPTDLAEFFNYIDLAIFPGTISITTHQSTGCGTPIILYNSILGLEDRVEGGRGYLFSEPDELLSRMDEFYVRKHSGGGIDFRAVELASSDFSWSTIIKTYLKEYEAAIAAR